MHALVRYTPTRGTTDIKRYTVYIYHFIVVDTGLHEMVIMCNRNIVMLMYL